MWWWGGKEEFCSLVIRSQALSNSMSLDNESTSIFNFSCPLLSEREWLSLLELDFSFLLGELGSEKSEQK